MTDLVSSLIRNIWGSDKPKEVKEEVKEEPKETKDVEKLQELEKPQKRYEPKEE